MGTKIQANAFFPKNHPVIDLNGSTKNGFGSLRDNLITRIDQDQDPLMNRVYQNGYSVCNIEKVRQTILNQESIFRNQLQELHRVYRRQRDLMNELQTRDVKKAPIYILDSVSNKHFDPSSTGIDRGLSLCLGMRSERARNEHLFDGHAAHFQGRRLDEQFCTREFGSAKSSMLFESFPAMPRDEVSCSQLEICEPPVLRKKGKIFGVEIFEGNAASNLSTTLPRNDACNSESFWKRESIKPCPEMHNHVESSLLNCNYFVQNLEFGGKNVDARLREDEKTDLSCKSNLCGRAKAKEKCGESDYPENCKGGLPWFLKNTPQNGETSKGVERTYFMNLDSLRNCSKQFFTKSEAEFQGSTQKHEISAPMGANEIKKDESKQFFTKSEAEFQGSTQKHEISAPMGANEIKKDENDARNQLKTRDLTYKSSLRCQIDLNLSLDEQDVQSAPYLPEAIVKIATTKMDLEASAFIESVPEPDVSPKEVDSRKTEVSIEKLDISSEESDRSAADALICISLSGVKSKADNDSCKLTEATLADSLYWFAEVVSSQCASNESREDSVPEGMDYFEFMTLKLEDVKDEYLPYNNSTLLNVKNNGKTSQGVTICKGPRKRAREQKNFKRDVLPGLVTLSRHEMKEDLKAFEEIRKAEGHSCKSKNSAKKGRGRKRSTSPSSAVSIPELRHVDGSLVGWGKRTKRLPRKRCRNMCHLFPVE